MCSTIINMWREWFTPNHTLRNFNDDCLTHTRKTCWSRQPQWCRSPPTCSLNNSPPKFTHITFPVKLKKIIQYYTAVMNSYSNCLQNRDYLIASLVSAVRYRHFFLAWTRFYYSCRCFLSLDSIDHDGCDPAIDAKEVTLSKTHTW